MPRHSFLPFLLAFVLGVPCARAGAADSLTLAEAVRLAGAQSPRVQAREAGIAAAEAEAGRAGALPDPKLMLGIENLPVTGSQAFEPGAEDMTMKVVGLRQEFPATAKRKAERGLAARKVNEAQALALSERRAAQRAAAQAWIEAWGTRHEAHALGQLREQAALAAKLAHARAVGGGASLAEALAADAGVLEVENQLEEVRAREAAAVAALRRWLPAGRDAEPVGEVSFENVPTRAQLLARVEELAPLLAPAAEVETAAAAVDLARAERRPDWSLSASYGQRERDRSDMFTLQFEVGLPMFRRQRQERGVQAREAEYQQALATREDERRLLVAEVEAAYSRYEALQRQVALHEQRLLPLSRDRSALALAAYRGGGELQPWLDARAAELEVHRAHAEHFRELGQAWAALAFLLPENTP